MPQITVLKNDFKQIFTTFFTKTIPSIVLSLSLFAGGIFLLALRISGWSLILGLPAVQIGIVFLIFTFDDVARRKVGPESLHQVPCSICGKIVLTHQWEKEKVCIDCHKKFAQKVKLDGSHQDHF
jgi:hypothetical protein